MSSHGDTSVCEQHIVGAIPGIVIFQRAGHSIRRHPLNTKNNAMCTPTNSLISIRHRNRYGNIRCCLYALLLLTSDSLSADIDWMSFTFDNDTLINDDSGYSNGLFLSTYDVGGQTEAMSAHDFWVSPLMWSMPAQRPRAGANTYTIGQVMNTPSDITVADPPLSELPYSGMLFFTNNYLKIFDDVADRVGVTIGVVGPLSGAEATQKFVHDLTDANEPKGWDTQLENELVFQLTRGRIWRSWISTSGNIDLLTVADVEIGTISSSVNGGFIVRYGRDLISSFSIPLLSTSRTTNPASIEGGWYIYAGFSAGYIFNQIFTDGNTFRDSRSIDYDPERVGASVGVAYSWQNYSLTFAVNDVNIIQDSSNEALDELTEYGTLTFGWRY